MRNHWGDFAGSDDGYEWIPYEQLMGDGIVCVTEAMPDNLHVYEHDPLGWCNSFMVNQPNIWVANVFRTDSAGEVLEAVSFYTQDHNTSVEVKVYNLGASFAGKDPTAGSLLYSVEKVIDYAGYHTLKTDSVGLTEGNYFSVVMKITNTSEGGKASIPVETAIKRYSDNAAVYDRESFYSDDGTTWVDGTDMIDEARGNIPYHINACIKAFTIAPNFTASAAPARTISNVSIRAFTPAGLGMSAAAGYNTMPSGTVKSVTISLLDSDGSGNVSRVGENVDVNVYLIDKSRTYEPAVVAENEKLDSEGYPKGRTGPVEWVNVNVYSPGYKPDFFYNDNGINYPVYGPFSFTTNVNGQITIDTEALKYSSGKEGKVPQGYYTFFCEPSSGQTNEIGVVTLAASDGGNSGNGSSSGSGGGCSAGMSAGIFMLAVLAAAMKKTHRD